MYNKGTIKVAWFKNQNYNLLYSKMFNNLEDALSFAAKIKDFMIMELVESVEDEYKWKLLPYGNYQQYNYGMKIVKNKPILMGLTFLACFGLYKLINK